MSLAKLLFVIVPIGLVIAFFVWPFFGMLGIYGGVIFVILAASIAFVFWPFGRSNDNPRS